MNMPTVPAGHDLHNMLNLLEFSGPSYTVMYVLALVFITFKSEASDILLWAAEIFLFCFLTGTILQGDSHKHCGYDIYLNSSAHPQTLDIVQEIISIIVGVFSLGIEGG